MSWRDILGAEDSAKKPSAHNSHNSQKPGNKGNCADIADCAEGDSKLLETLATACNGLAINPKEVKEALVAEDLAACRKGEISIETLTAFANVLVQRREMDQGKCPTHYTKQAICKQCGPVWLWFAGEVLGCPWCWNRVNNRPMPRPQSVCCAGCAHFTRINHLHLGHCSKGEPEAIAGLWDTEQRRCKWYFPKSMAQVKNED